MLMNENQFDEAILGGHHEETMGSGKSMVSMGRRMCTHVSDRRGRKRRRIEIHSTIGRVSRITGA